MSTSLDASLGLNPAQRDAVTCGEGAVLVVAGAGSGKTRVLTARVAWLIERGETPESLLAFTFTNRAAREMRGRIEARVGERAGRLWVGTFHGTGVRILRREAASLGLPQGFVIYDREDQEGLLREVLSGLGLAESSYRPSAVLGRISDAKNALVPPEDLERLATTPFERGVAAAYAGYRDRLRSAGALDFDDLIAEPVRLFRDRPEVAARYARRFRHVLVDEYQDTNHAQFLLVRALGSLHGNVFVVGDDDQSIYGWRGANLANVLEFEQSFPGATVIRLEQNYRSTGNILAAANAVIAHNRARKGKTLWCDREAGDPLHFWLEGDEAEEASRVRTLLEAERRRGRALADCAVLYRTNAQSRALETEMRRARIPYEIVGGVSFFQRREVKDLLAYLRLVVNPADTAAFWRAWNTPRRGLGAGVRAAVERRLAEAGGTPPAALRALLEDGALARPAAKGAADFLGLIETLAARVEQPVDGLFGELLAGCGYLDSLGGDEEAAERRANVQELGAAAAAFAAEGRGGLAEFLAETALLTDVDRMSEESDRVLLMTAHNAKGLEFGVVIVTGLEEGLLPHAGSLNDEERLEEERRLFYVALTRARDAVHLTAAAYRRRYDTIGGGAVSRFVDEVPRELLEREGWARWRPNSWRTARVRAVDVSGEEPVDEPERFVAGPPARPTTRSRAVGRQVYHETFGRGVVMAAEGDGADARYTVRFDAGVKKVIGRFLSGGDSGD